MTARRAMAGAVMAMAVALLCCATANAAVDCSAQFNAMQPCIEYVNSNTSAAPSKPCCTAFNNTQINMPVCLCQLQQSFSDPATAPGNVTRANQISALCAVAVDPSRCPALLGLPPTTAPVVAPAIAPIIAPVVAPAMAPVVAPAIAPAAKAPAGADVDCSAEFNSLTPCVTYVSSSATTPPATCCSALTTVHVNKPVCLCQLLQDVNADPSSASGLNVTKALELPTVCKVAGADVNNCPALLGQPVASPLESPLTAPVPESAPAPEAGEPGTDAGTPAPEVTPAVSGPAGSGANSLFVAPITAASMLLGFAALMLHFLF